MSKRIVFVGIGRGEVQRELTRKYAAELMEVPYEEFKRRFSWDNLYGEEIAPRERTEDARRAESLRARLAGHERAILLGERLADALGCGGRPKYKWFPLNGCPGLLAARTPHTSRQNWNTRGRGRGEYWAPMRVFLRTVVELY